MTKLDLARSAGKKLFLTKIDAAEAQLRAAVRMFFQDWNLVPIYTLANAVREVVGSIGKHLDIDTILKDVASARGVDVNEMIRPIIKGANFLKHADRDPTAKIVMDESALEFLLFLACHDFGRVAKGMPVEAQVFEAWFYAATIKRVSSAPLRNQQLIRKMIAMFPGLRVVSDRSQQKNIGLQIMERAVRDRSLELAIMREVPPSRSKRTRASEDV